MVSMAGSGRLVADELIGPCSGCSNPVDFQARRANIDTIFVVLRPPP